MIRKTSVLHILWSGGIGGTEEYITSLVRQSDLFKYEIHLCFLSQKGVIYEEAKKIADVNVVHIGMKNGFDIVNILKLIKYLRQGKFDIIHSHMRNFLSTAILAFFACKVPKVLTHHVGPVDAIIFKKNKVFYRIFSGVFRVITAISNVVKANLIDDFGVRQADKVKVVYNCINLEKFIGSSLPSTDIKDILKPGRYIIGFVGRMEHYKRPRLFVEIASELLKKDKRFYFVMVGDGPELEKCRKMINDHDIDKNFKLLGFRRDIPNIIGLFDALLFTSFGEGFGLVLLEAMAMGVPVFAIDDGAVSEIVIHKENGILFDIAIPEQIAVQILEIIKDRTLMDRIKEQCKKDVCLRFGMNNCVREFESIYEKVLVK